MRILLVEASGRGFLSHYTHALGLGLQRAGAEVRLLTGRWDELWNWPVPYRKQACLEVGWRAWRCVRSHVEEVKPDLVHLQWVDNPVHAYRFVRWAQRRGVRVVYTPHNILPHERRWLLMPAYRMLYRAMDRVVARDVHLAWALEELLDTPRERVAHLPGSPNFLAMQTQAVETASPLPRLPGEERRLLFFGHGSPRKGLDGLLRAVAAESWPESTHLLIAGENVMHGISAQTLAAARAAMRISVIDRYVPPDEVAVLFRDADLLLMPYTRQCKSPLLDLAASLHLPVLRSDQVQGADFREGLHGVTFPQDDPSAMCDRLQQMDWLTAVKRRLEASDDSFVSLDRLSLGHVRLYQALMSPQTASADDGLNGDSPLPSTR
ncbi:MAG: glycosyltransferase family 4 protein [Candidatus Thiodiazotropha sp.]